jgi:ankyrin repeat protein
MNEQIFNKLVKLIEDNKEKKCVEFIKKNKDLNYGHTNNLNNTLLILASSKKLFKVVNSLIDTGSSHPEIINDYGHTALMHLVSELPLEKQDLAIKLINTGQSNPKHIDNTGHTALMYARENNLNAVETRLLVELNQEDIAATMIPKITKSRNFPASMGNEIASFLINGNYETINKKVEKMTRGGRTCKRKQTNKKSRTKRNK